VGDVENNSSMCNAKPGYSKEFGLNGSQHSPKTREFQKHRALGSLKPGHFE